MGRGMGLMLCLGFLLVPLQNIYGEEGILSQKGLGLTAGALSGIGLAYRQHFENRWGFQIGGGIWGNNRDLDFNMGLVALRTFDRSKSSRFYGMGGVAYHGSREKHQTIVYEFVDSTYTYLTTQNFLNHLNTLFLGVGIGMEIGQPVKGISGSFELPFVFQREFNKFWRDDEISTWSDWKIVPIPSVNLIYYFR
ncbi:hypothetical protein IIA15_06460 [candidate division TA06 bacterium]|nr:hypothetical protein [candidate division TA06 bacterium]